MSRERKFEQDKQSEFAKLHYQIESKKYLSDIDSVSSTEGVVYNTENEIYSQYDFKHNNPSVTNIIERKYKPSDYLKSMLKKQTPPDSQIKLLVSMCDEINQNRKEDKIHFYLVVESEGKLPFFVFDVYLNQDHEVCFNHVATISTNEDYIKFFS